MVSSHHCAHLATTYLPVHNNDVQVIIFVVCEGGEKSEVRRKQQEIVSTLKNEEEINIGGVSLSFSLFRVCVWCGITITCLILIYLWHVSRRCVAVDRLTHRRRRRRLSWHWNKSFAFVGGAINLVRS